MSVYMYTHGYILCSSAYDNYMSSVEDTTIHVCILIVYFSVCEAAPLQALPLLVNVK